MKSLFLGRKFVPILKKSQNNFKEVKVPQKIIVETSKKEKRRKFGYLASLCMVTGSVIGGGVFVKTQNMVESSGSEALVYAAWVIGGLGIILMGLALIEIFNTSGINNKGIQQWADVFMGKKMSNVARIFLSWFYFPINYMVLPYYAAYLFYNAFGKDFYSGDVPIWEQLIVTITFLLYFIFINGFSTYIGKMQQVVTMFLKMIPIIALMFIAIALPFTDLENADGLTAHQQLQERLNSASNSAKSNAFLGLMVALPSALFAYDGFYESSNITENMISPKKRYPIILVLGLSFIVSIYILISFAMIAGGGDGLSIIDHVFGYDTTTGKALKITLGFMMGVSISGVLNGFCIGVPRFYEREILEGRLPFSKKAIPLMKKWNKKLNSPLMGSIYSLTIAAPWYVLWIIVGIYGYKSMPDFNDVVADWLSVLIFLLIATILIYGIKNRFKPTIKVQKSKFFLPCAIVAANIFYAIGLINFVSKIKSIAETGDHYDTWSLICVSIMIIFIIGSGIYQVLDAKFKIGTKLKAKIFNPKNH